jgi:hypothetical protein
VLTLVEVRPEGVVEPVAGKKGWSSKEAGEGEHEEGGGAIFEDPRDELVEKVNDNVARLFCYKR